MTTYSGTAANAVSSRPVALPDQNWPAEAVPVVSILCMTYNHERFIRECIRGFLMQETSFPVEIIVHDDASTDRTQQILKEYCANYPLLFKPVFQEVNRYSLGDKPSLLALPHASGRYIAVCEGDDFWVDRRKLERQVSALERYSDCDLCFHPALVESDGTDICADEEVISNHGAVEKVIDLPSVIEGDGGFCPTASLLVRKRVYEGLPPWYAEAPVGDYYLQIIASARGGALYLPHPMSGYRQGRAGSWSTRMKDRSRRIPFLLATLRTLYEVDIWLDKRHSRECARQMVKYAGMLKDELRLEAAAPAAPGGSGRAVRKLTAAEKLGRFWREIRLLGTHRAVTFALGHRLFLLGNRMKRWSALAKRYKEQP